MDGWIDDLARAMGFLTRLPVAARFFEGHSGTMERTPRAFPLAGAVVGAVSGLFFALLIGLGATAPVAALLAVTAQIMLTGALHEDGLADTADGFGSRDRIRALAIMKDSRIGAYGVIALVLSISLRVAAVAALANTLAPLNVALCLIAVGAASRGLMVWHWRSLPPARPDGVAAGLGQPDQGATMAALALGLALAAIAIVPFAGFHALVVTALVAGAIIWVYGVAIGRHLGGQTGDTLGACQQIGEITALVTLSIVL